MRERGEKQVIALDLTIARRWRRDLPHDENPVGTQAIELVAGEEVEVLAVHDVGPELVDLRHGNPAQKPASGATAGRAWDTRQDPQLCCKPATFSCPAVLQRLTIDHDLGRFVAESSK